MSLFESLSAMTRAEVPIVLQSAQMMEDPKRPGRFAPAPLPGSQPVELKVHMITPNELCLADAVLSRAKPPVIEREEPNPNGVGMVKNQLGYDLDHPAYLEQRQKLLPLRYAMIVIFGCDALRDSTPGDTAEQKGQKLNDTLGAVLMEWLAGQIEGLALLNAVGEQDVAAFFQNGSVASQNSGSSSARSQPKERRKRSKGTTGPTSTTNSAKPPASGE